MAAALPPIFLALALSAAPAADAERGPLLAPEEAAPLEHAEPHPAINAADDKGLFGWHGQFQLNVLGKVGASAAHVWNIPTVGAAPGVGLRGVARINFARRWRAGGVIGASFGGADDGSGIIGTLGSYGGSLRLGYHWMDYDWVDLWSDAHVGVQSLVYIPIPTWGVETTLTFTPVQFEHFAWTIGGAVDAELYVIAPSVSPTVETGFYVDWWGAFMGLEAQAGAQVIVAVVANSAAARAQVRWVAGYVF